MNGIRIGSIAGIAIHLDGSLLIIFALIAISLGLGVFPGWHPDWGTLVTWVVALVSAALLLVSVLIHELSHALVGRAQGIEVKRITLFVFGGMAQLTSEPQRWRAELWMAIVGPITSLVIGAACLLAGSALVSSVSPASVEEPVRTLAGAGPIATILLWLGPINIALALFNMVPGFPLDGGRVLRAALWGATGDLYRATRWAAGAGRGFAWLLIAVGFAMIFGLRVPYFGTGLVGGLWLALIGWFLNNAAIMSYRQLVTRRALDHVAVSRVMSSRFTTVEPQLRVADFVDDYLLASEQRIYPVVQDGRLAGMVGFDEVRSIAPNLRGSRTVGEIMIPARDLKVVAPGDAAADVLERLSRSPRDQLPVVEGGAVRGVVRREDILMWLALHDDPELTPG